MVLRSCPDLRRLIMKGRWKKGLPEVGEECGSGMTRYESSQWRRRPGYAHTFHTCVGCQLSKDLVEVSKGFVHLAANVMNILSTCFEKKKSFLKIYLENKN